MIDLYQIFVHCYHRDHTYDNIQSWIFLFFRCHRQIRQIRHCSKALA